MSMSFTEIIAPMELCLMEALTGGDLEQQQLFSKLHSHKPSLFLLVYIR